MPIYRKELLMHTEKKDHVIGSTPSDIFSEPGELLS